MTSNFVGKEVSEVRDLLVTSAVSGVHCLLLGAPGCGKTAMSIAAAEQMVGRDKMCIVRFNPTTSNDKIEGPVDIASLMVDPPVVRRVRIGTPYDQNTMIFVADEVSRPNENIFDVLLDTLDMIEDTSGKAILPEDAPVTFGTGNFLPKGERTEALLDRFGIYKWIGDGTDPKEVARAKMMSKGGKLSLPGSLPNAKEIYDVRSAVPGLKAIEAVVAAVDEIAQAAMQGLVIDTPQGQTRRSFGKPNNRRVTIWQQILLRRSILDKGTTDFDEVSKVAKAMCAYAWVSRTPAEAADWKMLVGSLTDPVGAAIDQLMVSAFERMNATVKAALASGKRQDAAQALGLLLSTSLQNLAKVVPETDPRYIEAQELVTTQFAQFISNKRDSFGSEVQDE